MTLAPVALAPPQYAAGQPRPDMMMGAGTYALTGAATAAVAIAPRDGGAPEINFKVKLADWVEMFEASEEQSRSSRDKAERDVDYYDGKQISSSDWEILKKRGQPALQLDQIKAKVNFLSGMERSQRTDPRALPRNPGQDEADATSATDALRFLAEKNRLDQTRSRVFRDLVTAGWGGFEVVVEGRTSGGNPNIIQRRTPWDRMFWDPYSSMEDFTDAGYLGLVLWMDKQEATRRYGADASKVFDETIAGDIGGTYDDKPKTWTWASGTRKRVRIVQMYYQDDDDGDWYFCEFTRGGILNFGPSPWLDGEKKPCHPYAWRSAYVDRDNNRYGEIRAMIDGQDAINKIASKLLHLFTVRQTFSTPEAIGLQSAAERRKELARPDGHIMMPPGSKWGEHFGIIKTDDLSTGMVNLMSMWQGQLNRSGPSATTMGKGDQDASGRSILAQQQGGTLEAGALYDTQRDMDHEVHRKTWARVQQFWTQEEWIRVTEDPKSIRFVGLNETARDPMTGQPMVDPMTGQPVTQKPVAELDVDIIIADAPATQSLHGETFQAFVKLAGVSPSLQNLPPEFWLEISDIQHKDRAIQLLAKYEQQAAENQPPPNPLQMAGAQAELENKQADTQLKVATANHKDVLAHREAAGSHLDVMDTHIRAAQALAPQPAAAPPAY